MAMAKMKKTIKLYLLFDVFTSTNSFVIIKSSMSSKVVNKTKELVLLH